MDIKPNSKQILFHGSRGGLDGPIAPKSRTRCDFGKGFYMGSNPDQAKSLVANDTSPFFYTLSVDFSAIAPERILVLSDMEWAFFVLFNRGQLANIKTSSLYRHMQQLSNNKDFIVGPIADDAMNEAMSRFIDGDITDKAFLESIRVIDYGMQFVAKTPEACAQITVLSERPLHGLELEEAMHFSHLRRKEGSQKAFEIQLKYRREGKYLDELLQEARLEKRQGVSR